MSAEEEDGKFDVGWFHSTVGDFINLTGNAEEQEKQHECGDEGSGNDWWRVSLVRGPDSLLQASVGSPSSWQRSNHRVSSLEPCLISCLTVEKKADNRLSVRRNICVILITFPAQRSVLEAHLAAIAWTLGVAVRSPSPFTDTHSRTTFSHGHVLIQTQRSRGTSRGATPRCEHAPQRCSCVLMSLGGHGNRDSCVKHERQRRREAGRLVNKQPC